MSINRRHAVAALAAAGLLWGTTVPLSKLALEWLPPGWLTVVRFGLAAAILLAVARGRGLRGAFRPAVLAAGALGYGGSVMVQNAGIARTSVTHAALLIGAVPVLVAIIAAAWYRAVAAPVAWFGFVVSLGGVGLVTVGGGGGGATLAGDGLVLVSLLLSATVTVAQGRLLAGRDPIAVTAVQFLGATLGALPVAVITEGVPAMPHGAGPVLVVAALALAGTLAPFTLFAFGQSRVSAEVAGAFLNLEPLVGAIAGAVAFGDPVGLAQVAGGLAILAGIGLSSLPLMADRRVSRRAAAVTAAQAGTPAAPVTSASAPGKLAAHRVNGTWVRLLSCERPGGRCEPGRPVFPPAPSARPGPPATSARPGPPATSARLGPAAPGSPARHPAPGPGQPRQCDSAVVRTTLMWHCGGCRGAPGRPWAAPAGTARPARPARPARIRRPGTGGGLLQVGGEEGQVRG